MTVRIITADVMDGLAELPDESVHTCVTSPPYWGLRDYGVDRQIGLEPTPQAFVARMVEVFREVRRVLRKDGTLWLNMGDAYAGSWGAQSRGDYTPGTLEYPSKSILSARQIEAAQRHQAGTGSLKRTPGLKPKDLMGMPWRVAFALQADGWWLRSDIIWSKPNPMPESVTDRPTKAHEYVFLLTKAERYFYDAEAIKDEALTADRSKWHDGGSEKQRGHGRRHAGFNGRYAKRIETEGAPSSRNTRSVWTIATAPFPEAHFATFPPGLPEICIKAGTSEKGCCAKCGAPWGRETEREFVPQQDVSREKGVRGAGDQKPLDASNHRQGFPRGITKAETLGWLPFCSCSADVVPCTVLDPFAGAGTTGLVADRLQRNAILIELNPDYVEMIERRLSVDRLERGIQSMDEVAKAKLPPTPLEALMQGEAP